MGDHIHSIPSDPDKPASQHSDPTMSQPGALRGEVYLSIQTRQAKRLIYGRADTLDKAAIIGLVGFADRLRLIWQAASQDDPWADWWLIKIDAALTKARESIRTGQAELEVCLKKLAALEISVATSQKPFRIALKFANPYAYRGAQMIAAFDELARTLLTCRHVGMLSNKLTESVLNEHSHAIRGVFTIPQGYQLLGVNREGVRQGTEQAATAAQLMGLVPAAVLSGQQAAALTPKKIKTPVTGQTGVNPESSP